MIGPRSRRLGILLAVLLTLAGFLTYEATTSELQSRILASQAAHYTFRMEPGASDSIAFPDAGPQDERRGYAWIPVFEERLARQRFEVTAQARLSPALLALGARGRYLPYHEKPRAGLTLTGAGGDTLYAARFPRRVYTDFDSIPDPVRRALLFIENRELLDPGHPYRNPAVEWDRLAKAVLDQLIAKVRHDHPQPGGSTLATQIEKYRHSPGGVTGSARDKLQQMLAASYRAYLDGRDTRQARRRIVLEYLNSVPLASVRGHGEVIGIGEGLWAWFDADFDRVNAQLRGPDPEGDAALAARAEALKQVLALLISQKRPALFLIQDREKLGRDTESYLRLLGRAGVISPRLLAASLGHPLLFRRGSPALPRPDFIERKAALTARTRLLSLLGLDQLYVLDRIDLTAGTTLLGPAQRRLAGTLRSLAAPAVLDSLGLRGPHLMDRGDPAKVVYSLTLFEATHGENLLRVQVDNWDQPLDVNEGTKLDLGSSAKFRTLVTYLEIVAGEHARYAGQPADSLRRMAETTADPIRTWMLRTLADAPDTTLPAVLEGALDRRYSASPHEAFMTGGGRHSFVNLTRNDDDRTLSVREAFRQSVNLVFIRLMRDVVRHTVAEIPGYDPSIYRDRNHPLRAGYLSRFADREGKSLLARFYPRYQGKEPAEALHLLAERAGGRLRRAAAMYRFVVPDGSADGLAAFLDREVPGGSRLTPAETAALYRNLDPAANDLQDRGYLAGVGPLELWLVAYLRGHPGAAWKDVVRDSESARQESYRWLFQSKSLEKQNKRIAIEVEAEAFRAIHRDWKRLGYPFDSLVPSYATAIGSSGDRPAALAELMGIIVNDGVRLRSRRLGTLAFAAGTPYETVLASSPPAAERVLPPEVARAVRGVLLEVVENGTARRCAHAFPLPDGTFLEIGGKTGTGDHRFETFNKRGLVVESRVVNRAATFVFLLGKRYYGTITAYVPGPEAANYDFTSALAVAILARLGPGLMPSLEAPGP